MTEDQLELKSPSAENVDIWDAFNQIQTYKDEVTDLFAYNEAAIISEGYHARVGSLSGSDCIDYGTSGSAI